MPGGRIDILVAPDTKEFAGKLKAGLQPALGVAGALGGALGLAFGGAAAFGEVIKLGNDYTVTLNTMKAVSSATADQMAEVSAKAKQLGNDITLPGTSASDAAEAMTELAKGGFTVQQSMDAAKGSLQLAAAAQIDAAQAATIQSAALQSFGLQANQAGRVADVLANTANASSAEITDVAYALQSSGAVAHQFGLTIEDTATAIGLFANSGIKGSDAGTLLKSALLAITDQGKPAKAAISELGLSLYDAQGKFVGLESLFGQLQKAAQRMTPQMYQAATTTLFGSDAARLAGVAAEKGAAGFDQMHDAMSKQGSAAAVAAAKMQGLPGAMEQVENAAQGLALEVYDLVKGPLEQFTAKVADTVTNATPHLVAGLHEGADAVIGFGQQIAPVVKTVADLPTPVLAAAAAMVLFRTTGIGSTLSSAVNNGSNALRGFGQEMQLQQSLAAASGTSIGKVGASIATLEARVPVLGRMSESYQTASQSASVLARTQGTVAAASTGLRSAASGVVSLLGGPWVVALTAATLAVSSWIEENAKAEARQKAMNDLAREGAQLRTQQAEIFSQNNGAFDTKAIDNATQQVGVLKKSIDQLSENRPGFWQRATTAPWDDSAKNANFFADRWSGAKKILDDLQMSDQQLAETLADTSKFNDLSAKLQGMGQDGRFAASALQGARDEILKTQETAKNTTPGFATLSAAVKTLADQSASASDRVNAMKTALDLLSGKPIAVQDALAKYNAQVRDTAAATADAWDKSAGFGAQLVTQNGQVDTTTANGAKLYDELTKIRDATITAAEAGANMDPILTGNERQFTQLAQATGLSADQVRNMAAQLGLLPHDIQILAQLKGADSVEQQLVVIDESLRRNAKGVDIPVDALTDDTKKKLEEVGVKIDAVNGKPGVVHVSSDGDASVMQKLDEIIAKQLPTKTQQVNVEYNDPGYHLDIDTRRKLHENIDNVPIAPAPRADGGVSGALPGQATIQSPQPALYQWAEPETGGEAFIPLASSKRERSTAILGTVAQHFGLGLTKMADGGIATNRALSFLRSQAGKPYQYGGVGNPSWDCSAFISAAFALVKGLDQYTRWFTTESNFSALGFISGLDPTGRGLSIGVHQGGGGQYSHMVGDINGVALESGGNGVQVGAGATAPSASQFELKMYLPASAFNPPDEGGRKSSRTKEKTWDESDDLELQSAVVSARKAHAQAAKDAADPKKTPDDKTEAQISAQQADIRVKQLEQKRDEAKKSGGAVPSAPPLTGNLTDDQIKLQELHQSTLKAKDDRDDVYADSTATDSDRKDADLKYQQAINDERKEQQKQAGEALGLGGDSSNPSVVGLIGDAVKAGVTGQISDVLNAIGLGGDIGGAVGAGIGIGQKIVQKQQADAAASAPSPATPSQDEIQRQGPVVPGSPGWFEQLLKTFSIPMVLRDQGGVLPHGVAALNLSGQDEYVQSPGEYARSLAAGAQPAPAPINHIDGSFTIQNLHTGMSAGEFRREMRMVQLDQRQRVAGMVPRPS